MSRFFSSRYAGLDPYVPGEQPQDRQYIKLNTNESPFPMSPRAMEEIRKQAEKIQLYPDPECSELVKTASKAFGIPEDCLLFTNGSDEILNFAFMAYCDSECPAVFPNITYGFYPVFAGINGVPFQEIPLREDFSVEIESYFHVGKTIFLANPNAPTGIALKRSEIEQILYHNPDNIVVIDEAYVDFGAESCLPLIRDHDNLLVTQTFSKSRSMAGARLGFGAGSPSLIEDLRTIKYSTNPYNINRFTAAAGIGALLDQEYTAHNCERIRENREYAARELRELGFVLTPSEANFLFAKHPGISGEGLYQRLKQRGILVRHFSRNEIRDWNRITVGSRAEMEKLINTVREIVEDREE